MGIPLFVYGTLKRSSPRSRHRLLQEARFVKAASMAGRLYDLGRYPGVFRDSAKERVRGELYEIPDASAPRALRALDRYEGRQYVRRRVYVRLGDGSRRLAWTYLLRKRPPKSVRQVTSGRYRRHRGVA
jgi:gamma-glutamylcyclotransferase (GGCT)/AIG2-like uncharacterized protein YtfP